MTDTYIAVGQQADLPHLARILRDWVEETGWLPKQHTEDETEAQLGAMIARGEVLVLRQSGGVAGFVARNGALVSGLYLRRDARGRGLGRDLLAAVKARAERLTLWTLAENHAARAFYAREGFVEIEATDGAGTIEGLPDVRLEWRRE